MTILNKIRKYFNSDTITKPITSPIPTVPEIRSVTITNSGAGYTSPPNITTINALGPVTNGIWNSWNSGIIGNAGGGFVSANLPSYNSNIIPSSYINNGSIVISSHNQKELLRIDDDGTVAFSGTPNEAAKKLITALQFQIDKESVKERTLAKYYKKGIEHCLNKIKNMDKEEFIVKLEEELHTRTAKEMLMYLKESPEEIKE